MQFINIIIFLVNYFIKRVPNLTFYLVKEENTLKPTNIGIAYWWTWYIILLRVFLLHALDIRFHESVQTVYEQK